MRRVFVVVLAVFGLWTVCASGAEEGADWPGDVITGTVAAVLEPDVFTLTDRTTVMTGPGTVLIGLGSVADLLPGDEVRVEGSWIGGDVSGFQASLVELLSGGSSLVLGVVAAVGGDGVQLAEGLTVLTGPATILEGLSSLDELARGDLIAAEGQWSDGTTLVADRLALLQPGGGLVLWSGTVAFVADGTTFVLDDGITVATDADTELVGIGEVADLVPGDAVEVDAVSMADTGQLLAARVERLTGGGDSVTGLVEQVFDDTSFLLDDGTTVETGGQTTLIGFTRVADLLPGDLIQAVGARVDMTLMADTVTLLQHGGALWLVATVTAVPDDSSFELDDGTLVVTDELTLFIGIDGVPDLRIGDLVQVECWLYGGVVRAASVELLQQAPDPVTLTATVSEILDPDTLILDNGMTARVGPTTVWIGVTGISGLAVGDRVRVTGITDPLATTMAVDMLELLEPGGPDLVSFEGVVDSVAASTVTLVGGVTVAVDEHTVFEGFGDLSELRPGDRLAIEAYTTGIDNHYDAVALTLLGAAPTPVELVSTVSLIVLPDRFVTADGHQVLTMGETLLVGLLSLEELAVGDTVWVSGWVTDPQQPLDVVADVVELQLAEPVDPGGGSGLRSTATGMVTELLPPDLFVIDDRFTITTSADTEWEGDLTGYGDLALGLVVWADLLYGTHDIRALAVTNLGAAPETSVLVEGMVTAVEQRDDDVVVGVDSGDRLVVTELTVLDGDVATADEIVPGMLVSAEAVPTGDGELLALTLLVLVSPGDIGALGFHLGQEVTEVLVVVEEGENPGSVAVAHGATVAGVLPGSQVRLFEWNRAVGEVELQLLLDDPAVADIEPNYAFTDPESDPESVRRRFIVADRYPSSGKFTGQAAVTTADITAAHARTIGAGTVVAVVDTGVDPFHPLFRHRLVPGGWDFVDDDDGPWETADGIDQDGDGEIDESAGHGTFVAGLVLLTAPGTAILPYRVLDDDGRGSNFDVCLAVLAAMEAGADVINMSFAYGAPGRVLDRILMEASERGIVLVSGAGNAASTELPFPASDSRVIAVAAAHDNGRRAHFSNFGPGVGLAAPGVDLYSAAVDQGFGWWGGTSMAAPFVSGAAALLRSVNPYLTPNQIEHALVQASIPVGPPSPEGQRVRTGVMGRVGAGRPPQHGASVARYCKDDDSEPEPPIGLLQVAAALALVPTAL